MYITYASPSPLGASIGLFSLGGKIVWCKHGGTIGGFDLKGSFELFKTEYCKNCQYNKTRDNDWNCTVGWIQTHEKEPEFQKVIENIRKNSL